MDLVDQHAVGCDQKKQQIIVQLLQIIGGIGILYVFDDQPVPFIYVHTLYLMSIIYIPMVSYTMASHLFSTPSINPLQEIFGIMTMMIFMMFTQGLISIGRCTR
jgi:hypothetical protein